MIFTIRNLHILSLTSVQYIEPKIQPHFTKVNQHRTLEYHLSHLDLQFIPTLPYLNNNFMVHDKTLKRLKS